MRNLILMSIVGMCLGLSARVYADSITLTGTDQTDNMTMAQTEWKIWGSYNVNYVGYKPKVDTKADNLYRSALKFDVAGGVSGVTANQITSAKIYLYAKIAATGISQSQFGLYRLRRTFDPDDFVQGAIVSGQTTWQCSELSPTVVYWSEAGASSTTEDIYATADATFTGPSTTAYEWVQVDVTQYVKDVLNGANDYGWMVRAVDETTGNYIIYNGSTNVAGTIPYLVVEYSAVPEPMTVSMVVLVGGIILPVMRHLKNRV